MLRRATKRTKQAAEGSKGAKSRSKEKRSRVLGDKGEKDVHEKMLEKVVLGDEQEILEKLGKEDVTSVKEKKDAKKTCPKPVWDDEDDDNVKLDVTHSADNRYKWLKLGKDKEITGDKYKQKLHSRFEKVSGTPSWARLKWEKSESEGEESDTDELLQTTGNYLASSEALPKTYIQMKRCPDANKEDPALARLTSVQFHPSAKVILTAGMNQTLGLFQVDGKNNPKIQSVFLEKFPIYEARFSANGEEVIMGSRHPGFCYYDMMAGKVVKVPKIKGLEEWKMDRFRVSPDGRFLAFLGHSGRIHLISAEAKEWITSLKMNGSIESLAFSRDGSMMYSVGGDAEVYVWDLNTRDCIHRFTDEGSYKSTCIAASKNGQYIACGSNCGVVNIYDDSCLKSHNPKPVKAVMNLTMSCNDLVFNSTTEILAMSSGEAERAVKLLHVPSLTVFANYPERTDSIRFPRSMDFSVHSGYFAIGNNKGCALLYRVEHYRNY